MYVTVPLELSEDHVVVTGLVGFAFGFFGSVPLAGPIAVMVFGRGLAGRFRGGLYVAVGAAIAEGIYAALAYWGLGAWLDGHALIEPVARALAAAILVVLGVAILRGGAATPPPEAAATLDGPVRSAGLGFVVTALNPTLIGTWAAATAGLFSANVVPHRPVLAPWFAISAAAGITVWFSVMLLLLRRYRDRLGPAALRNVSRAMGVAVLGLAAWLLISAGRALGAG